MCLKNGGFFKTSQLSNGGFAYIWYPLMTFLLCLCYLILTFSFLSNSVYYLSLFDLIYFSLSVLSKSKDNSTCGNFLMLLGGIKYNQIHHYLIDWFEKIHPFSNMLVIHVTPFGAHWCNFFFLVLWTLTHVSIVF
jgi:hypothetical protein